MWNSKPETEQEDKKKSSNALRTMLKCVGGRGAILGAASGQLGFTVKTGDVGRGEACGGRNQ